MKEYGNGVIKGKTITNPVGGKRGDDSLFVTGLNTRNGIFNELK
jgi:hypothetical protein